ncbi:MAG: serine/threonine-protein kinase, partial [Dehalococcoidia bacterium]
RQLGAGGMGQVFLVQHPRLPRQDALKLLDAGVSRDDEFKARFQREADLLAQLSHPNIVTLYDRGEFEDRLWITMEYVEGTDASELFTDGPVDADLAVSLVAAAGAALDYAWRKQRVTHRDVKPANILVGIDKTNGTSQIEFESVKLADFGIAKAAGESTSLTSTGMTIGTMQYIAPEAIEGEVVDNRSDVYSLGCTAFHLLTGQPPFTGATIAATMSAHLTKAVPSVSTVNEHLPQRTDAVFGRVLAKNPDDRFQSCAEFVTALQEAVGGAEVRYPASAPTLAAATSPKRGVVDPGAPTQLRESAPMGAPAQRKSRAVPILASAVGVLAAAAAMLGVYASRGGSGEIPPGNTPTSNTSPAVASMTPPLPTTASLASPPPLPPAVDRTARDAAEAIKAAIPEITQLVALTEATDDNNLLGRPNGYSAAVVLIDPRSEGFCEPARPGADCGATVEQWPDQAAAQARADYLQKIRAAAPILGSEWNTVNGKLLLRVTGALAPSTARNYEKAFTG